MVTIVFDSQLASYNTMEVGAQSALQTKNCIGCDDLDAPYFEEKGTETSDDFGGKGTGAREEEEDTDCFRKKVLDECSGGDICSTLSPDDKDCDDFDERVDTHEDEEIQTYICVDEATGEKKLISRIVKKNSIKNAGCKTEGQEEPNVTDFSVNSNDEDDPKPELDDQLRVDEDEITVLSSPLNKLDEPSNCSSSKEVSSEVLSDVSLAAPVDMVDPHMKKCSIGLNRFVESSEVVGISETSSRVQVFLKSEGIDDPNSAQQKPNSHAVTKDPPDNIPETAALQQPEQQQDFAPEPMVDDAEVRPDVVNNEKPVPANDDDDDDGGGAHGTRQSVDVPLLLPTVNVSHVDFPQSVGVASESVLDVSPPSSIFVLIVPPQNAFVVPQTAVVFPQDAVVFSQQGIKSIPNPKKHSGAPAIESGPGHARKKSNSAAIAVSGRLDSDWNILSFNTVVEEEAEVFPLELEKCCGSVCTCTFD